MKPNETENEYLIDVEKHIHLSIGNDADFDKICDVAKALSAPERIRILKALYLHPTTLSKLAEELNIPLTSLSRHMDVLSDAQLVRISYRPSLKGHVKYCSLKMLSCKFSIDDVDKRKREKPAYSIEMPVGMFSSVDITPPCGMVAKDKIIGLIDDPRTFYLPERNQAEKLWFSEGSISYHFPLKSSRRKYSELSFSFELCSETACYNPDWPSDITISVNDIELTTFTSIGDFGGRRGKYTASNWSLSSTQFGLLRTVSITENGVFFDHTPVRDDVTFKDVVEHDATAVKFTLSIKKDATHRGGLNLFGKRFGDYPQAIVMTIK